ncbi:hypothetical protein AFCDBAGC_4692 [Methylobacterium cerastii]|uniref:DUF3987 domain-containing protein n=1 Tax=Methylobacterium cerastii TaxID=932741 RepID=A0ABQ4QNG7_9HYPH|nr:DUF3987 domain-containing protein [Methylobacterium cerastii]GJD46808.1 hypothetical protein AFCDBAGC_4692 [Methylobacterium cerastii]
MLSPNIHPDEPTPQYSDCAADEQISSRLPYDTARAVDFLCTLRPNGRIAVAAIVPDGALIGATFMLPAERAQLTAWISARQGVANLHFRHNEPVAPADQRGKAGTILKSDVAILHGIPVDLDPGAAVEATPGGFAIERQRLLNQLEAWGEDNDSGPSVIIDSGGGVQAVWLFAEPLPATPENIAAVEAQGKALARRFGGDAVQSVEHLLRIPHTINLPHAKKRAKGRVSAATRGRVMGAGRRYSLAALARIAPPIAVEPASTCALDFDPSAAWDALGEPDRLDPALAETVAAACAARPAFARLLWPDGPVTDRSERDFAIASECVRAGIVEMADVAAVIAAYSPEKFEAKAEHGDAQALAYLGRTIARALERVAPHRPEAYFDVIEDDDGAPPSTEASAFGEPVNLFCDDDPADLATPPAGCLPSVIEGFVKTEALRKGVPEAFAAIAAITVVGGAIGNALTIQPRRFDDRWKVPAAFPAVIVARPGRKKSPLIAAALEPLKVIDRELFASGRRALDAWETAEADRKHRKALPQPTNSRPVTRQHVVDDATLEKQVRIHADNPRGIIRAPDELASFLGAMGAYKRNGDGDRSHQLRLLDGGDISLERVCGTVRATSALMGLLASTQPEKIRALARDLGSDGMLQRFVFVVDDEADRLSLDMPPDEAALSEYASAIRALAAIDKSSGGTVQLSAEAHTVMAETWAEIRKLQRLPGSSAAWEGHVSKWEGLMSRILLIFHALETWAFVGCVPLSARVSAETATKASRFCFFLLRHAWRFYAEYHDPAESTAEARWIAGWLLTRAAIEHVTPREIEKARRSLQGNRRITMAAMRDLETAGWVNVAASSPEGPTSWRVNPRIFERFAERAEREKSRRTHERRRLQDAIEARRRISDAR